MAAVFPHRASLSIILYASSVRAGTGLLDLDGDAGRRCWAAMLAGDVGQWGQALSAITIDAGE
jgi:hypothetical protein